MDPKNRYQGKVGHTTSDYYIITHICNYEIGFSASYRTEDEMMGAAGMTRKRVPHSSNDFQPNAG